MNIRALALATVFTGVAAASFAADLPARAPAPFIPAAPIFTWTGFYIGVNAGGAWSDDRAVAPTGNFLLPANAALLPFVTVPGNNNNGNIGFTGGVTVGYNWQMGSIVFGVEGDANFLSRGNNNNAFVRNGVPATPFGFGPAPNVMTVTNGNNNGQFVGTARLRLGYAVDRALFFITGGAAFRGSNNNNTAVTFTNATPAVYATFIDRSGNNNNIGFAVGGGLEYAFSNNWTVKGEYIYAGFGNKNRLLTDPVTPGGAGYGFITKGDGNLNIVRLGVNYKF